MGNCLITVAKGMYVSQRPHSGSVIHEYGVYCFLFSKKCNTCMIIILLYLEVQHLPSRLIEANEVF